MKYIGSYLLRAVFSIIIGILLVRSPESIATGLTMLAGFLFLLSGIISCSSYISILKYGGIETLDGGKRKPMFPIVGLGSMVLGALLVFSPDFFVRFLMYIFGGLLVLGAINEFVTLARIFRMVKVSVFFWIMPSLILITGLVVLFKPMASAELPFIISGWCLLVYGISEIIQFIKLYSTEKNIKKMAKEINSPQEFSDVEDFEDNSSSEEDAQKDTKDE